MSWENKVLWTEGMFLRTQHFQQMERSVDQALATATQALRAHAWGLTDFELNEGLLKTGVIAISRASGILDDSTVFHIPTNDRHPAPFDPPSDLRECVVHLAVPMRRPGAIESSLEPSTDEIVRYIGLEAEVPDTVAGSNMRSPVTLASLHFRLLHDKQDMAGYSTIPVCRMVEKRIDQSIMLDPEFIPTVMTSQISPVLANYMSEIRGLLQHRGNAIASRLVSPSGKSTAELTDFLLLMLVNRTESLLRHAATQPVIHPEELFRLFISLSGELATFTEKSNRAPAFPDYRHRDLTASYKPVINMLRDALSAVFEQTAIPIPLELRKFNIRVAKITDKTLFKDCTFIFAAKAPIDPEKLRLNLPKRTTIGPVERIRDLVNLQLGGAPIRALPSEPRQIPFRAGFVYFEINTNSEDWQGIEKTGGVSVHVSGDLPDLEVELWAIRGRVR
jgi:type VI secretion system protein ImpJ